MSDIFFLVLRRLRVPLIILISVYAISTFVLTLIPGVTPDGETWTMSFFHAFYFVSFMGTTIGFGEIPYEFTDMQRAWVLVCIYTSVTAWLYAIGHMLSLLQDETFRNAILQRAFQNSIKRIDLPFYIIGGYGETGRIVRRGLTSHGLQTVIIDHDANSTNSLELENLTTRPIVLTADITLPSNLIAAGLNHAYCQGVIAVTNHDHTNLQIAVASKLVNPNIPVICRSEIDDEAQNMASFGTNAIINPYHTFARRLALLVRNPSLHHIQNWFINQQSTETISPNIAKNGLPKGKWIICGYGRLGKAIQQALTHHTHTSDKTQPNDIELIIVDPDPIKHNAPANSIVGRGTEAKTLHAASINQASVVIAASHDDANNLSIIMTAKQINPKVITIARASKEPNHTLFDHAQCDYVLRRSQIVANEALTIISRPLVTKFIQYSNALTQADTQSLIQQVEKLTQHSDPITWRLTINDTNAWAIAQFLKQGKRLKLGDIVSHPRSPKSASVLLLLKRNNAITLLPELSLELELDDELLLCGSRRYPLLAQQLANNGELLDSLVNNNPHHIPLLRWWSRRHSQPQPFE